MCKLNQKTDKRKKKANEVSCECAHEVLGVVQTEVPCGSVLCFTAKDCSAAPWELAETGRSALLFCAVWQHVAKPSLQNLLQL